MFALNNKVALVTGATGGIGSEISKILIKQGASVIISGSKEERLQELSEKIITELDCGEEMVKYLPCDLSDVDAVESLIDRAEELFGQIDILICNAGITKDGLVLRMKNEDFESVIDVNLRSTFILNRNAIKKMVRQKHGRIVNIASVVGVTGNPGQCNYVASKAGMIGMSKSLAQEVASRHITINCVAPGFILSPMTDVLTDQQKENLLHKIPMGHMGCALDIANAVAFLVSDESSYITGHTLHVNGGMFMN